MVWEQGSTVIVNLTCLMEDTVSLCHRYWPESGSDLYHIYEVGLNMFRTKNIIFCVLPPIACIKFVPEQFHCENPTTFIEEG